MEGSYLQGVFPNMSNEEHHSNVAAGSSGLKLIKRSPLHCWHHYQNPDREPEEETKAKKIGTAWHCAFFEPSQYAQRYITLPDGLTRKSREGRSLIEELENDGLITLTPDEAKMVNDMAASSTQHPVTKVLFSLPGARTETSIFAIDPLTGAPMKIRPDFMTAPCQMFPNGLIVDGKSCKNASDEEFGRDIWNWEMLLQAAFYCDVYQLVFKTKKRPEFLWHPCEKDEPHDCNYFSATEAHIAYGRQQYKPLLKIFAECLKTGQWPGYSRKVRPASFPGWADKLINDTIQ